MNGNALGFGHAHVLLRLGVAPGLHRAAVAELRAVALFLPDDHDGLGIGFFAAPPGDDGPGDEHAGVEAVLVLPPDFREVVVDVLQDITQADTLRVTHDAHLVHGGNAAFKAAFHIGEKVLDRGQLCVGVFNVPSPHAGRKGGELFFQQLGVVFVLAGENVHQVAEPVAQALDAFFYVVIHDSRVPLNGCFKVVGGGRVQSGQRVVAKHAALDARHGGGRVKAARGKGRVGCAQTR